MLKRKTGSPKQVLPVTRYLLYTYSQVYVVLETVLISIPVLLSDCSDSIASPVSIISNASPQYSIAGEFTVETPEDTPSVNISTSAEALHCLQDSSQEVRENIAVIASRTKKCVNFMV